MAILPAFAVLCNMPRVIELHNTHADSFKALLQWMAFRKTRIDVGTEPQQADMVPKESVFDYGTLAQFCILNKKFPIQDIRYDLLEAILDSWVKLKLKSGHQDQVLGLMGNDPLRCGVGGRVASASSSICLLLAFISQNYFHEPICGDSEIESMDPKELIRVLITRLEKRRDWRAETTSALGSLKSRRPRKALKTPRASHDGGHGGDVDSGQCMK